VGIVKEQEILTQAKRGQGETNERLDALLAEVRRSNDLLLDLIAAVGRVSG
jgi:hypothetical protein